MGLRRWRGVLAIEDEETGDGRLIVAGALEWGTLPLPLAFLDGEQHGDVVDGAVQVGVIETITRDGNNVVGEGVIDDENPAGAELIRRMEAGVASMGNRQRLSIDPDNYEFEIVVRDGAVGVVAGAGVLPALTAAAGDTNPDGGEVVYAEGSGDMLQRFTRLRIRGATACAISAFDGAWMELAGEEAVTASAPVRPPSWMLRYPEPTEGSPLLVEQFNDLGETIGWAVPLTITDAGHVFGHVAYWGACHIGYRERCLPPPREPGSYSSFNLGVTVCDDGAEVPTGSLVFRCDHADGNLRAPDARDHYAHTGVAWADVHVSGGQYGIWMTGALRPDVTDEQIRELRGSQVSGDWRRMHDGSMRLIAVQSVPTPGFPIERGFAASAARAFVDDGELVSLIAAGVVARCSTCGDGTHLGTVDGVDVALLREMVETLERQGKILRALDLRTRHLVVPAAEYAARRIPR